MKMKHYEDYKYIRNWYDYRESYSEQIEFKSFFGQLKDVDTSNNTNYLSFLWDLISSSGNTQPFNIYFYFYHSFNKKINNLFIRLWNEERDFYPEGIAINLFYNKCAKLLLNSFGKKWDKLSKVLSLSYTPLEDSKESYTRDVKQATDTNITSTDSSESTLQNKRKGFGSINDSNTTGSTSNTSTESSSNTTGALNNNQILENYSKTGVNKYTIQDLLKKEVDVSKLYEFLDVVCDDISSMFCERYSSLSEEFSEIEIHNNPIV